jgi:hypothetical protein
MTLTVALPKLSGKTALTTGMCPCGLATLMMRAALGTGILPATELSPTRSREGR